jgi:hypothetical protein
MPVHPAGHDPDRNSTVSETDGKVRCPWCPTHKRVRLRTNGTLWRHQPYGKNFTGAVVPPCPGSGKDPKTHPKFVAPAVIL